MSTPSYLLTVVLLAVSATAHANFNDPTHELRHESAYLLPANALVISSTEVTYGILGFFELGAAPISNALGVFNGSLRGQLFRNDTLAFSLSVKLLHAPSETFAEFAVPLSLDVTYRPLARLSLHASLGSLVLSEGTLSPELDRATRIHDPVGAVSLGLGASYRVSGGLTFSTALDLPLVSLFDDTSTAGEDAPYNPAFGSHIRFSLGAHVVADPFFASLGLTLSGRTSELNWRYIDSNRVHLNIGFRFQ